jgi:glycosyltransferase involved in cell wall biosynthesis
MRIAQVAPLYERVPPLFYGGTERIVSYLTEELISQGHELTLFASGDSLTKSRLIAPCAKAVRLNPACEDPWVYHFLQLEQVFQNAAAFDIIHFHIDYLHYPFSRRLDVPQLTTLHGRLDQPDLVPLYREFCDMPVVSISNAQRNPLRAINWLDTVYHGLPTDLYQLQKSRGSYLAFLGRISPEKRPDRAIEIAKRANLKLKIAAKVDPHDRDYMEREIRPLLDHPLVEFVGEINDQQKGEFLGEAAALLFPIDWDEPFGLVMIEAMACGTPTIAFRRGSVAEIIDDGITGFVVDNIDGAVDAIDKVKYFDRQSCRKVFESRFSVKRMAAEYLKIYERLTQAKSAFRTPYTTNLAITDKTANGKTSNGAGSTAESDFEAKIPG